MKILVCGGRDYDDQHFVFASLDRLHASKGVSIVIHGDAPGADTLAGQWAEAHGIHFAAVPALWNKLGRKAGPLRNEAMLQLAPDAVVAFPGGRGTAHMVGLAKEAGIKVWEPAEVKL